MGQQKPPGETSRKGLFHEEDCERPACDEMNSILPKSMAELQEMRLKYDSKKSTECPPASASLGKSSWTLLHSMAAWYPDIPTEEQQNRMKNFYTTLAEFYPCTFCAKDFEEQIEISPVQVESRTNLCLWLCEQHNLVNEKLGKDLYQCNINNLDERWRKSSTPKCNQD